MKYIHYFRRDLRIEDNDALTYAINNGLEVMPVFILDPYFKSSELNGPMRYRFLLESLIDLDKNLQLINLNLTILVGNTVEILKQLLNRDIGLTYNYDIQVEYGIVRDDEINQHCLDHKIPIYMGLNQFTKIDDFVFDKWFGEYDQYKLCPVFKTKQSKQLVNNTNIQTMTIEDLIALLKQLPKSDLYTGGQTNAWLELNQFLTNDFDNYYWQLSRPYLAQIGHTSHLSAHIAFGTISTRQVHQRVKEYLSNSVNSQLDWEPKYKPNKKRNMSSKAFLDRLRWRDAFTNRLVFHPQIEWGNKFDDFDIHYNPTLSDDQKVLLEKWKTGTTGYPLIDAAMRQLLVDGWMIFRLRAMCASFLCFHLGVSWHYGAIHFMNYLVDGDVAINHWQWQMQAGATDPYNPIFRVYNPTKNIPTKDPKLRYIHHWVPETRQCLTVDDLIIHFPPNADYEKNMTDNKKKISNIRKSMRNKFMGVVVTMEEDVDDNQLELF